ncbi:MAG: LysR family transcriptional regulator [Cyclobacteriaceae bacterium]|nr:LysR family transcriptional regulator [Cyclobacteriaceae bacterium]
MKYTLHQLQVFHQVAQHQSITKASEELHLTQPAVSIQLKNFQDQFSIPLTEVVGRKLFITDFGKEIAAAAERILQEVQEIDHKTTAYSGKLSGRLKVSVVSTGKYVIPYILSGFLQKNPDIEIVLDVTNKARVIESLEKNEVDFSLVSILPDTIQVEKIELMPNQLYLVGNGKSHVKKTIADKKIVEQLPLIFREQGSGTRQTMERFFNKYNITVRRKMELTSNEAVKQAVLAGLGYSIMPLIGIRSELIHGELQLIPVKGLPIQSKWQLIWVKGKKFSPVAHAFAEYVISEKKQILENYFGWTNEYV